MSEGLQEVAVTEEVGRRSRVRAFRFPRARAKGSCCVGLPWGCGASSAGGADEHPTNRKTNKKRCFSNIFNMEA